MAAPSLCSRYYRSITQLWCVPGLLFFGAGPSGSGSGGSAPFEQRQFLREAESAKARTPSFANSSTRDCNELTLSLAFEPLRNAGTSLFASSKRSARYATTNFSSCATSTRCCPGSCTGAPGGGGKSCARSSGVAMLLKNLKHVTAFFFSDLSPCTAPTVPPFFMVLRKNSLALRPAIFNGWLALPLGAIDPWKAFGRGASLCSTLVQPRGCSIALWEATLVSGRTPCCQTREVRSSIGPLAAVRGMSFATERTALMIADGMLATV
mmetsp:Transcript_43030/g.111555  ORF Transcript_43030/g.111555 Transcript_43030/m.111555 type:complete len:266 (+) Transcript_43030:80-877(+)